MNTPSAFLFGDGGGAAAVTMLTDDALQTLHAVQARRERQSMMADRHGATTATPDGGASYRPYDPLTEKDFLLKRGEKVRNWKKRLFVLKGNTLRWFNSEKDCAAGRSLGELDIVGFCEGAHAATIMTIQGTSGRQLLVRSDLSGQALLRSIRQRARRVTPDTILEIEHTRKSDRSKVLSEHDLTESARSRYSAEPESSAASPKSSAAKPAASKPAASKPATGGGENRESVIDMMIGLHKQAVARSTKSTKDPDSVRDSVSVAAAALGMMAEEEEEAVAEQEAVDEAAIAAAPDAAVVDVSDSGGGGVAGGGAATAGAATGGAVTGGRYRAVSTAGVEAEAERMRLEMIALQQRLAAAELLVEENENAKQAGTPAGASNPGPARWLLWPSPGRARWLLCLLSPRVRARV